MTHRDTILFDQIQDMRSRGIPVSTAVQVDAVVDSVVRGWGSDLLWRVEQTADGVLASDLLVIHRLIRQHLLTCTVDECVGRLQLHCCEYVYGPTDWAIR